FCLMGNHYHLLLETPEPNLVKGMRRLNGVYTQAFNRRHHRVGHVLQGRYKSILVDKDSHLKELCRYVVLNPVRAGMVPKVQDWHWSSYLPTAGRIDSPTWLAAPRLLALFGHGAAAQRAYERFVAEGIQAPSPWQGLKGQMYLGSEAFTARMQRRVSTPLPRGVPRRQLEPGRPSLHAVLRAVAAVHGLRPADVLDRRNGLAFKHAVYLLRRRANLSLAEVAKRAGVSIGRVAQIQSGIETADRDPTLVKIVAKL